MSTDPPISYLYVNRVCTYRTKLKLDKEVGGGGFVCMTNDPTARSPNRFFIEMRLSMKLFIG